MPSIDQHDETPAKYKASWSRLVTLLVVATAIRAGVLYVGSQQLARDPDAYRRLAETLRNTGVYGTVQTSQDGQTTIQPTAFRPPLYPVLLALLANGGQVAPVAIGALHLLFGVATVALAFLLSQSWGLGRWSLLAALLVTCDPILLNQSAQVMTETLATLLAVAALYCLTKLDRSTMPLMSALAGGVLALAVLCRPTFLPWLGLAAVVCTLRVWRSRSSVELRESWHSQLASLVTLLFVAAMIAAPWAVRNYRALGRFKATTTHGGYTLLLGNNPSFYQFLQTDTGPDVWDSSELSRAWSARYLTSGPDDDAWNHLPQLARRESQTAGFEQRSELQDDRFAYQLAERDIRQQPAMFVQACAVRIGRLWRLLPHALDGAESTPRRLARYGVGLWYGVLFLLAGIGAASLRGQLLRNPWLWGVLLCLVFTAVHTFYWSNMRMRAPLMPFVCLLAAHGSATIFARWNRRK